MSLFLPFIIAGEMPRTSGSTSASKVDSFVAHFLAYLRIVASVRDRNGSRCLTWGVSL